MTLQQISDAPVQARGHRWFAAMYDPLFGAEERRAMAPRRRRLLSDLRGDVLEIGAGTGANFEHYSSDARVIAFEPDPFMLERAREKLDALGRTNVDLRQAPAEELPVADASFDAVVSTLVLCTVRDVPRALAEMRRVLRPGGRVYFIEHVRGEGVQGRIRDLLQPIWSWFGAGCHPNRRTERALASAGFDVEVVERGRIVPWMIPVVTGFARPSDRQRRAHEGEAEARRPS